MLNAVETVERLKERIDRLTEEPAQALKTATYIGMTPDETEEYENRRSHILMLIKDLERLEKAA